MKAMKNIFSDATICEYKKILVNALKQLGIPHFFGFLNN